MQQATFGAGCFWGVQHEFDQLEGVKKTTAGYMGGHTSNPTYEEVCSDKTGHAEVVHIEFDENNITYDDLLKTFWNIHDPTQKNRQGPDIGSQYRSVIFFYTPEQKLQAEQYKNALKESGRFHNPIMTEIKSASTFTPAEEYHQHYFKKHGVTGCHF